MRDALAPLRRDPLSTRWLALAVGALGLAAGAGVILFPRLALLGLAAAGIVLTARMAGSRIALGLASLVYVVCADWVYANLISWIYVHYRFEYYPLVPGESVAVMALAWLPALLLPGQLARVSQVVAWSLYGLVYVPAVIIAFHDRGFVADFHAPLLAAMVVLGISARLPRIRLRLPGLSSAAHRVTIAVIALLGIAFIVYRFGLSLDLPGLQDVADTRTEYKALREPGSFTAYAVPWLGRAVFPFAVLLGLRDRRIALVAVGLLGSAVVYETAGFRSAALLPLVMAAAYFVARRGWDARTVPLGLAAVIVGSAMLALGGVTNALSLLVRRTMMLPGQLTGFYHEYFSANETYQLRHSILDFLGDPPYPAGYLAPDLIGDRYLSGGHANANVWADAMANFGVPGLLVFTMLLSAGLWVTDVLTARHDSVLVVGVGAIAGFTYSNTGLLTGSLSAGVGLLILLMLVGSPVRGRSRTHQRADAAL